MLPSKYSSLPDIDTEPEVYETPNIAPVKTQTNAEESDEESEPDNEDIIKSSITATEAAAKFKSVCEDDEDAKRSVTRHRRAMYKAYVRSAILNRDEIESEIELETPRQKLRRLIYEVQELGEDITKDEQKDKENDVSHSSLLKQVQLLQSSLGRIGQGLDKQVSSAETDSILSKLQSFTLDKDLTQRTEEENGKLSGHLETLNAIELEPRLKALEELVGKQSIENETNQDLVSSVSQLSKQLNLFTAGPQLDVVERRVKMLQSELQHLSETQRKDTENTMISKESENRLERLHQVVEKIDPLVTLTPSLLTRLSSLQSLHLEVNHVAESIHLISQEQKKIEEDGSGLSEIFKNLEASLDENTITLQRNIETIDMRIGDLAERLHNLGP
ncbi:hypothetical protein K7432_005285 [Basidiobolus ranarum]|uniref:Dynactin subunit 2 n=1 Tax=Basidiobolus ranarum TaxID=34480 RepID=A0ABR2W4D1_9FUNG